MNIQKIKEFYLNKICTILTKETAIPIKNYIDHAKYFTGEVIDVDQDGVWLRSLETKTVSLFTFPLCGIVEEQFIPETHPEAKKIKEELDTKNKKPPVNGGKEYISVDSLTEKIKKLKN